MKEIIEIELSLEHIHPELIDVLCEVEVDYYQGSTDSGSGHLNSEDPSEIEVLSITLLQDLKTEDGSISLIKGKQVECDSKLEEQINEKYSR